MKKLHVIEQLHRSVPQTKTKEGLAKWITENQKEVKKHEEHVPLTPEEIQEYEHKSSVASRALDVLKEVEEEFKGYIKKGTNVNPAKPGEYLPQNITIPPTKGTDALKANRQFADEILRKGYNEIITEVYMIPFPEEEMMVAMTIEGYECPDYTRAMTEDEKVAYASLFVKNKEGEFEKVDTADVQAGRDGVARIKTRKKDQPFI